MRGSVSSTVSTNFGSILCTEFVYAGENLGFSGNVFEDTEEDEGHRHDCQSRAGNLSSKVSILISSG